MLTVLDAVICVTLILGSPVKFPDKSAKEEDTSLVISCEADIANDAVNACVTVEVPVNTPVNEPVNDPVACIVKLPLSLSAS